MRGHEKRAPEIETVYIPEADRGTLCISSQVGCTLTCSFCHTGTQRLVRNLEPEEIVGQILLARDRIGDWPGGGGAAGRRAPSDPEAHASGMTRKITNVVLMGMGEPLYNFDNVRDAMAVAADGDGLAMSKRRITLSTSGVVPQIARWGAEAGTMLAISLHAVEDDLRDKLVPINRKYPIAELMAACRAYPGLSNARRITFEYVMLKGVNDSLADAKALVRLLAGIPAKINLIPFNPWPGTAHECSDWEQIERFAEVVNRAGYASPVRTPRGRDIMAACGQLKSESSEARRARAQGRGGSRLTSQRGTGHAAGHRTDHCAADRLRAGGGGDAVRDLLARSGAGGAGSDGPRARGDPDRRGRRPGRPGDAPGLGAHAAAGAAAGDRGRGRRASEVRSTTWSAAAWHWLSCRCSPVSASR